MCFSIFFFKQKTAYEMRISDWSSDVCSSDLFEAAWAFFGGVFATVIPDNMKTVVYQANPLEPRLNQAFVEYAQARGCVVDPAKVRPPHDKPRVEQVVPFVRNSVFDTELFIELADAQRRGERWAVKREQ